MTFPLQRMRRMRRTPALRSMIRETHLTPADFIAPLFVVPGTVVRNEIASMPGQYHLSVDQLIVEAGELIAVGVNAVILFGIPEEKDPQGSGAFGDTGIVQMAVRALKDAYPDLVVITDVCMCEYTSHGHCGILDGESVDNDATLTQLAAIASSHAMAGADMIAPSDMMDGRVAAIRSKLDEDGFDQTPIMSYAVKYASAYYGPFRDAAMSAPQFGDRRSYQMDPANAREGLLEAALDEAEGADVLMVKPGLPYLDVLHALRQQTNLPLAAYNVSGEYAMIKCAAANGLIDGDAVMMETLIAIKRAGADLILTYFAKEAAQAL